MCQHLQDLHNSLKLCFINERCLLMLKNQPWGKDQFIDIVRACPLQIVSIRGEKKMIFHLGCKAKEEYAKIIGKDKNMSPFKATQQCEAIFFSIYFYWTIYLIRVDKRRQFWESSWLLSSWTFKLFAKIYDITTLKLCFKTIIFIKLCCLHFSSVYFNILNRVISK